MVDGAPAGDGNIGKNEFVYIPFIYTTTDIFVESGLKLHVNDTLFYILHTIKQG